MTNPRPHIVSAYLFTVLAFFITLTSHAQVLTLNFSGGNGTTLVDQFTGTAGSGWNTAWLSGFGSDTNSGSGTVINTTPITPGGGNYLHVLYNTGTGANRSARVSRQINTSAISLSTPITMSFEFRSDVAIQGSNQTALFFGSQNAISSTGPADSWKITIDGGGVAVYNGTTTVSLATAAQMGTNVAGTPLKFTLAIDPLADTYVVTATRLDTNVSFTSGTLALRNGADSSLSYMNFVANGGPSQTNLGYSLDAITVVPEPGSAGLLLGGLLMTGLLRWRRRP